MSYTLTASQVPVPIGPATTYALNGNAPHSERIAAGDSSEIITKLNENAMRLDMAQAFGGFAFGILNGLVLSAGSGLTANVSPGQAAMYGIVEVTATESITLPDNTAHVYVWLKADGTLTIAGATTECVYLGHVTTSGGVITSIDLSGVVYRFAGGARRYTADTSAPGDAPPSTVSFLTIGASDTWFWDGAAYHRLAAPTEAPQRRSAIAMSDANKTLTTAEAFASLLDVSGALTAGRDVVLPNVAGRTYDVINGTGQAVTFKVLGQAGVSVAAGKAAHITCNGTDYKRISPDT